MPDPVRVNEVREDLKAAQPSATAEERELQKADGQEPGVAVAAIDEDSPQALAQKAGTRVWNQWDDETAAKLQQEAGERPLDPDQSEGFQVDPTAPTRTTSLGVQSIPTGTTGTTGPTGPTGSTGATGVTGSTGANDEERRARQVREQREAEQLEKARNDKSKQTAKSGV